MIYLLAINSRLLKGQSAGLLAVGWIKIGLIARQPTYGYTIGYSCSLVFWFPTIPNNP